MLSSLPLFADLLSLQLSLMSLTCYVMFCNLKLLAANKPIYGFSSTCAGRARILEKLKDRLAQLQSKMADINQAAGVKDQELKELHGKLNKPVTEQAKKWLATT